MALLSFMELSEEGIVYGCKAKLALSVLMILMKHLASSPRSIINWLVYVELPIGRKVTQ